MLPLPGHILGQAGVAVRETDGLGLLHAGDAYFYYGKVRAVRWFCTPGLRAYQMLMNTTADSSLPIRSGSGSCLWTSTRAYRSFARMTQSISNVVSVTTRCKHCRKASNVSIYQLRLPRQRVS